MRHHKVIVKKSGLMALILLLLLATGLSTLPAQRVAADDLRLFEEPTLPPPPAEEYVPDQIIVMFKDGVASDAEKELNDSLGTEVIHTGLAGFKVLQIPDGKTVPEMVTAYEQQPVVEYAEPNYIDHVFWSPNDTFYSYQWHFPQINLEAAWDLDTTAPNYGG